MSTRSRHEHRFPDREALLTALAGEIRVDLTEAIEARGLATLIVSAGKTPVSLLERLSREALDWSRVWIGLSDENWVDAASTDSNERIVRECLLQQHAQHAHFVPMKNTAPRPEGGIDWAWRAMKRLPRPYDVVLLGMGEDGHFASLMPNSLALPRALDPTAPPACVAIHSLTAPHPRISLNLSALIDARRILVFSTGVEQWTVYQRARQSGSVTELPLRALLHQQQTPVDVYWAP